VLGGSPVLGNFVGTKFYSAHMILLMATSTFRLRRRCHSCCQNYLLYTNTASQLGNELMLKKVSFSKSSVSASGHINSELLQQP